MKRRSIDTVARRKFAWLLLAGVTLLLAGANGHLVYVAITSQPECVAHIRRAGGADGEVGFGAASSSCSPQE